MSRYRINACACACPDTRLPRLLPRSPSAALLSVKGSRVPPEGWTQSNFNTPNGERLKRDLVLAHRLAVSRGMKALVPKLTAFFEKQGEAVIAEFTRMYHNYVGRRPKSVETYTVDIDTGVHGDLWAAAIDKVLREQNLEFTNIMVNATQSTADTARKSTLSLIGLDGSALGQAQNNQRVRGMAAKVTGITETTRTRLRAEIERGLKDDLTVAEMVKRLRQRVPEIAAGRIPTIARTEMGRAADEGRKQGLKESGTVRLVSVVGCEAREPGSPTYRGESTCNIENVPIGDIDLLEFHINHTGTIIAAAFLEPVSRPDRPGNIEEVEAPTNNLTDVLTEVGRGSDTFDPLLTEQEYRERFARSRVFFEPTGDYLEALKQFASSFGLMPDTASDMMYGSVRDFSELTLKVIPGKKEVSFEASSRPNGFSCIRKVQIVKKKPVTATHFHLRIADSAQNKGFTKRLLSDQLAFYRKVGVTQIELTANMEVGGYAWARYGFIPKEEAVPALAHDLRSRAVLVREKLKETGNWDKLSETEQTIMDALSDNSQEWVGQSTVTLLAGLKGAISDYSAVMGEGYSRVDTLGKMLLLGQRWEGFLNLSDKEALTRFTTYLSQ